MVSAELEGAMTQTEATGLISELGRVFGQPWIDNQISKAKAKRQNGPKLGPKALREHIVASWVRELRVVAMATPQTASPSREDSLSPIAALLEHLRAFSDRPDWTAHICDRIKSDPVAYPKHLVELRVGSAFKDEGYSVAPKLPDGLRKSCDLEVSRDGLGIDVECKAQDHGSKRDAANFDTFSMVVRRCLKLFERQSEVAVRVGLSVMRDLAAHDCGPIVDAVRAAVQTGRRAPVQVGDLGTVEISPMERMHRLELAASPLVPIGDSRALQEMVVRACRENFVPTAYTYWYCRWQFRCEKKLGGRAFAEVNHPQIFGVRQAAWPDRTKSIIEHARSASAQVSGRKAALLYSEWRPPNPLFEQDDFDTAVDLLREHLPASRTLAAAVIFRPDSFGPPARFEVVRNPRAEIPLPESFEPARPR
jgi:hypothetical protein